MGTSGTTTSPLPQLATVDEVAEMLRTTRTGVWRMAQRGKLPGVVKVGRRLLFRRDRLLQFIEENSVPSPLEDGR